MIMGVVRDLIRGVVRCDRRCGQLSTESFR